jgi:DNA modification methylase
MIIQADARHIPLKDESVQTVVTSPPYWGLRDYGIAPSVWDERKLKYVSGVVEDCAHEWVVQTSRGISGGENEWSKQRYLLNNASVVPENQSAFCIHCSAWRGTLGLEPTPELYVQHIVEVFREVRRVLRKDGTCWVNLGDSYNAYNGNAGPGSGFSAGAACDTERPHLASGHGLRTKGLKPKDLVGIPWRVAFALQADGWWLRSDIIWNKPNPMPESVTDRPTKSHEYIFLLAKSERYYYDVDAIRELSTGHAPGEMGNHSGHKLPTETNNGRNDSTLHSLPVYRNKRSVWTVATQPYPEAHFATFPEDLITLHPGRCRTWARCAGSVPRLRHHGQGGAGLGANRYRLRFKGRIYQDGISSKCTTRIEIDEKKY